MSTYDGRFPEPPYSISADGDEMLFKDNMILRNLYAKIKIADRLLMVYKERPDEIAWVCDQTVDRTGNLLSWIRELAMESGKADQS